ncbi:phosphate starvation-inducible PhoH-like protein [Fluviicoccus keumensis]|uniref:PhoH-like protein n=1 Tax=Fluviicoccus keumensis TaxID=1435465 RepID=A0A4Q7ZDC8_9GAMM|nr:phosphate starvation-inducible PhoH-like protein [Fluviicoccus keumensis]
MNSSITTIRQLHLTPPDPQRLTALCGPLHEHIKLLEERLGIRIHHRGHHFHLHGPLTAVTRAERLLTRLYDETAQSPDLTTDTIHLMIQTSQDTPADADAPLPETPAEDAAEARQDEDVALYTRKGSIRPRGHNQRRYVQNILNHDISFGVGPAGTGKTYLAVACAVDQLERDEIRRILLVRPAVEAGEKLGFLPGDLTEKINPYLRPLYDALYEMLGFERVAKMIEKQVIEVAPLAYMRGRTLNHAFIILDEGQNTTPEQMKMFLTRLGFGSKAVITGDITQVDLPRGTQSGLSHAIRVLDNVPGIHITRFSSRDVVRHPLVQHIVEAYESWDKEHPPKVDRPRRERRDHDGDDAE